MKSALLGVVAILFLTASSPSLAVTPSDDLTQVPVFDVDARCQSYQKETLIKFCVLREQDSYEALKGIWSALSQTTKVKCLSAYEKTTIVYSALLGCAVPMQTRENDTFALQNQGKFQP